MADLTTLDAVKTWQGGLAPTNTNADGVLGALITATSADFLRAIQRPDLLSATYTERRTGDGSRRLILRHWPVTDVASVTINGSGVPAQAGSTDGWYLDTGADPERQFVLYLSGALAFPDGTPVPVTYTAGYAATPDDIAQAVTEWVVWRYNRKSSTGQAASRSVEGESAHFEQIELPLNTKRVIDAYKRRFAPYGTDLADAAVGIDTAGNAQRSGKRMPPR